MQTPFFLPEELDYCRGAAGIDEVYSLLQRHPIEDMVAYFEAGAQDHTWTKNVGGALLEKLYTFLNENFFQQKMPLDLAERVAIAVQQNFISIEPYIKEDLVFLVEGEKQHGSSLIFGGLSSFFRGIIARQAAQRLAHRILSLPEISLKMFKWMKEYFYTGKIELLWREEPEEILEVIYKASRLNIEQLSAYASDVFRRYINKNNVVAYFMWGREHQAKSLSEECCRLMGNFSLGFEVFPSEGGDLALKIDHFSEEGSVVLQNFGELVTSLKCCGKAAEDPMLTFLLPRFNRLHTFDLTETSGISITLQDVFPNVRHLILSSCNWLNDDLFVLITEKISRVTNLQLKGDTNLSFRTWGAFASLPSLSDLDLSQCTQIGNDDIDLIAASCTTLTTLNLAGCYRIADGGIQTLARQCLELAEIDMTGLHYLTEQGLIDFAMNAPRLRLWTVKKAEGMTPKAIQQIAFVNPSIRVVI